MAKIILIFGIVGLILLMSLDFSVAPPPPRRGNCQKSAISTKPGTCPSATSCPVYCNKCLDTCKSDDDCKEDFKCCCHTSFGCGFTCSNSALFVCDEEYMKIFTDPKPRRD